MSRLAVFVALAIMVAPLLAAAQSRQTLTDCSTASMKQYFVSTNITTDPAVPARGNIKFLVKGNAVDQLVNPTLTLESKMCITSSMCITVDKRSGSACPNGGSCNMAVGDALLTYTTSMSTRAGHYKISVTGSATVGGKQEDILCVLDDMHLA